jgi:replication-associated recombination protein RarA
VADGQTKSMVVSGHAGIGKSYTVRQTLEENINSDFTFIKGYVKPTGIFKLLWENRFEGQTIVFDDADAVFQDEVGLNLLKGALELTKTRRIAWLSEKEFISEDGEQIPRYFDYEGTIIFLTNLNFNDLISRGNKLAPHLQALESRSIYFDLQINTNRELMTRIKQVVMSSSILSDRGISKADETKLMEYLTDNVDRLKELSLRTVEKLAVLYLASPDKWINLANSVMIKR